MFFVSHSMFSVTHNMSKRKTVPVHQLLGFSHGLILQHFWYFVPFPRICSNFVTLRLEFLRFARNSRILNVNVKMPLVATGGPPFQFLSIQRGILIGSINYLGGAFQRYCS